MAKAEKRRTTTRLPRQLELAIRAAEDKKAEGYERSEWILLDYFDFIVHIFAPETRQFYGLERLWGNAERIEIGR